VADGKCYGFLARLAEAVRAWRDAHLSFAKVGAPGSWLEGQEGVWNL